MTNKERAFLVAEKAHANQSYDIYPYMYHVRKVAAVAQQLGYDESIIVACILHDTLEDTSLSYNDLKSYFGTEVAEIVYAVTDELGRNRKERKSKTYPKIRANWKAAVVKVCDRIANVEHSSTHGNAKLFKMYEEEQGDFYNSVSCATHPQSEMEKAWLVLHDLVYVKGQKEKV